MQLPNPNQGKPFDRVIKSPDDSPLWGIRNEHTPEEEIVNMRTQESNQKYWKPELVMNPEGCEHEFYPVDLKKREVICNRCSMPLIFHVGLNFKEVEGQGFITLNKHDYPLISH